VPGHCSILGNEQADRLARQVSAMLLPGPEPALGIPKGHSMSSEPMKNPTNSDFIHTW
jgi:hypothetical protein